MSRRPLHTTLASVAALAAAAGVPAAAGAEDRTFRVSTGTAGADRSATSRHAAISADGRFVAFDSDATRLAADPNGRVRDVFIRDLIATTTGVVSRAPGGPAADGPSSDPAISAAGSAVAFLSSAANLVPDDLNGAADVFVRTPNAMTRVSVSSTGAEGNARSYAPDISADGRYVAFASDATNLAPGDTNDQADVFVHDLRTGETVLVSRRGRESAAGTSGAPAISPDGRFVSFSSDAPDLAPGDRNVAADVFLADLDRGTVTRVSVSSREQEQDEAVPGPFVPISDVSEGGRFVVFDSDATNLHGPDANDATDVFLRDVAGGTTRRISLTAKRRPGDNDSFWPTITPDGRYVAFQSFAGNLSRHDGPREDLFVYDRRLRLPALIDVPAEGGRRGRERLRQLLQRPSLAAGAQLAAFSSTAAGLVHGTGGAQDVFVRNLLAAKARIRLKAHVLGQRARYRLRATDLAARDFACTLDGRAFRCGRRGRLPKVEPGPHVLRVRAGGAGMLWQDRPTVRRFIVR